MSRTEKYVEPVGIDLCQILNSGVILTRSQETIHHSLVAISAATCKISIFQPEVINNRLFISQLLGRIHKIETVSRSKSALISTTIIDLCFGTESFLSCDYDNTISCARTINGGSRSVFQDTDRFNVFRHNIAYSILHNRSGIISCITLRNSLRHRKPVNNPQRFGITTQVVFTTDSDFRTCTRRTGHGSTIQSRNFTFQNTVDRGNTLHLQIFGGNNRGTTSHTVFLYHFHTCNNDFIQRFSTFAHHHPDRFARLADMACLHFHTDKGELQRISFLTGGHAEQEISFGIGPRAMCRSL